MIDPVNDPRLPRDDPYDRSWTGGLAFVAAILAVLAIVALFTYGGTDRPGQNTAMNEQTAPIQTIPQQGTEQPAQPEQSPPPAGNNTTQP